MMFIKALKEHDEALQVVAWLKEDILGVIAAHEGGEELIDVLEVKNSASKL